MDSVSIHPSQRRFSCEACRKNKSRCQRIQQGDPKCSRCTILSVECTTGRQRKVGRRKQSAPASPQAPKGTNSPTSPEGRASRSEQIGQQRKLYENRSNHTPLRIPQSISPLSNASEEQVESCTITPIATPASAPLLPMPRAAKDTLPATATWPAPIMNSLHLLPIAWSPANSFNHGFSFPDYDAILSFTDETDYSLDHATHHVHPDSVAPTMLEYATAEGGDEISEALAKLSNFNLDLHVRLAAVEMNKTTLDLNSLLYREGPLFIDDFTLVAFMLRTSQDFLRMLTRLLNLQQSHKLQGISRKPEEHCIMTPLSLQHRQDDVCSPISNAAPCYPHGSQQPLLAPLALVATAIFTQLTTLFEIFLEHLTTRLERIYTDPIAPIPGLTFDGLQFSEPCTQGMLFANTSVTLLEEIERVLGTTERVDGGEAKLLSARQIDVLWSELDESVGVAPGHGPMRPAHVKRTLREVAYVFSQLSLGRQVNTYFDHSEATSPNGNSC